MGKIKVIFTVFLAVIYFAIIEFIVYQIFENVFQDWVWWFNLPSTAVEKQNTLLNIFVIVKIIFGFVILVILPLIGAFFLAMLSIPEKKK